jgi:hypothetical protein
MQPSSDGVLSGHGIASNREAPKKYLGDGGWFEPADHWNHVGRPDDRLWS